MAIRSLSFMMSVMYSPWRFLSATATSRPRPTTRSGPSKRFTTRKAPADRSSTRRCSWPGQDLIPACQKIIKDFYGEELPATSYVIQPPCQGKLLAIEAMGIGQGKGEVQIERFNEHVVRVTHNALSWVHCANVTPAMA